MQVLAVSALLLVFQRCDATIQFQIPYEVTLGSELKQPKIVVGLKGLERGIPTRAFFLLITLLLFALALFALAVCTVIYTRRMTNRYKRLRQIVKTIGALKNEQMIEPETERRFFELLLVSTDQVSMDRKTFRQSQFKSEVSITCDSENISLAARKFNKPNAVHGGTKVQPNTCPTAKKDLAQESTKEKAYYETLNIDTLDLETKHSVANPLNSNIQSTQLNTTFQRSDTNF